MRLGVLGDFVQDGLDACGRPPAPVFFGEARIHHEPGNVERPGCGIAGYFMRSKARDAPLAKLGERHRVARSAAEIDGPRPVRARDRELFFQERQQIPRMKTIAALVAGAIEPDIAQRLSPQIAVDPEGEDTLLGVPELPGAGEHAAAIDPDWELERFAVLKRENFRSELRGAVE